MVTTVGKGNRMKRERERGWETSQKKKEGAREERQQEEGREREDARKADGKREKEKEARTLLEGGKVCDLG